VALGVAMGVAWWALAPTEQWVKVEGGLGPQQLASSSWFGADGWFLVLGLVFGLILAALSWRWGKSRPVSTVVGVVVGAALLAVVAWSVGGLLGPPDPQAASTDVPVGATVEGSLGLRAMGVLAAPVVTALALLVLLLSLAPVREAESLTEPHDVDHHGAS
jgi:hypothetical protein